MIDWDEWIDVEDHQDIQDKDKIKLVIKDDSHSNEDSTVSSFFSIIYLYKKCE